MRFVYIRTPPTLFSQNQKKYFLFNPFQYCLAHYANCDSVLLQVGSDMYSLSSLPYRNKYNFRDTTVWIEQFHTAGIERSHNTAVR